MSLSQEAVKISGALSTIKELGVLRSHPRTTAQARRDRSKTMMAQPEPRREQIGKDEASELVLPPGSSVLHRALQSPVPSASLPHLGHQHLPVARTRILRTKPTAPEKAPSRVQPRHRENSSILSTMTMNIRTSPSDLSGQSRTYVNNWQRLRGVISHPTSPPSSRSSHGRHYEHSIDWRSGYSGWRV